MKKGRYLTATSLLGLLAIGATATSAQTETKTLQYDPLGRLISSSVSGGQGDGDTRKLCYDAMGNRTNFQVRNDGSVPSCVAPAPTPTPTPSPTPTPTPSNSPPVAQNNIVGGECGASRIVNVTANDTDPDGHYPLTVTAVVKDSGDASLISFSGSSISVVLGSEYDSSSFTYTVSDTFGATDTAVLNAVTTSCGGGGIRPPRQ